jgi:hypothetical protein
MTCVQNLLKGNPRPADWCHEFRQFRKTTYKGRKRNLLRRDFYGSVKPLNRCPSFHGSVEPLVVGPNVSMCLTVTGDHVQMFAELDSAPVVGTMCVLAAHNFIMGGKIYQALAQIMEDIAKGTIVHAEDWNIVWDWMQTMEAQIDE